MAYSSDFTRKELGENKKKNNVSNGTYESDFTKKVLSTYKPVQLPTPSIGEIAKQKYSSYNDALKNMSIFSNSEINDALKEARNQSNNYKKQVYNLAKDNNIETSNSKNIIKNLGEYRQKALKNSYENKYDYLKSKDRYSAGKESDKKYNENKEKFDKIVKTNDKYKEYEDYAYRAVPLLEETKNQREAFSKKTNFIDKIIAPFIGGTSNALNNTFLPTSNTYKLANGEIVRNSTKSDLNAQRVMSEVKEDDWLGKIYSSATYSLGNMTPSIVAGAVNPVLGATIMGGNTYKNAYNESLKEGYTKEQANRYATANTTLELGLGKALGGMTSVIGKSGVSDVISKSLSKVISSKATRDILADVGSEFLEEYLQEIIDPVVRNITLNENNEFKPFTKEALIAGISGSLNAGISNYPKFKYDKNREKIYTKENVTNLINNQSQNNLENSIVNSAINNTINENNINLSKVNSEIKMPSVSNQNNNIFSKQIDEVLQGKYPKRDMLIVSKNTPKIFQDLGLKDLPITMTQKHLYTMTNSTGEYDNVNYHNIPIEIIKQIPEALEQPLNVLKSDTKDRSIVAVTRLADNNGDIIVASIKIDGKGQINDVQLDTNVMTSAYGKSNNYDYWMQDNIKKGNLLYDIDEGIINKIDKNNTQKKLSATDRFQLPMRSSDSSTTISDIPKNTSSIYYNNDTTINNKNQVAPLPINNNIQKFTKDTSDINLPLKSDFNDKDNTKILNPLEISNLTKENANTTPNLPIVNRNEVGDGNSKFYNNIKDKTNMLNEQEKHHIMSNEEVQYYDKVTNKESLNKAFERLNKGGESETLNWFNKDIQKTDAIDVAEGWILMKQYADNGNYDSMVEVAKKMRNIGTNAGQTVQAFNIMERMTPEGMVKYAQNELSEAYDKIVKNKSKEWIDKYRNDFDLKPEEVQFIMDTMKEVSEMEDNYDKRVKLAEIQKMMTDKLPSTTGSKIKSWMRISMLFNPKTQVRNVVGNAIIAPVNYFGDLFSSYADKLIAKKTNVRTTGNMNIKAILKGFKEGAYQATNDYRKGINTKDMEGNRFEISEGKAYSDKNIIGRNLNRVENLLNYVMDAGDRVFSQSSFENSLQNQMILNNTTKVTQDMIDIARTESLQRTWNDNNNYTKFVLGIRKFMNIVGTKNYGLGDILIPFAKTPANITKAIVDYSPVGLVNTIIQGNNLKKSLSNGQYTPRLQHKFVQTLGKATAGTLLYVAGYALAEAKITTGESDDDKDTASFLKNTLGVSSYSIKIGDKTFTYDWAQPLAAPLSITANIVNSKNKDKALLEAIVSNLDTAGSILLEQSFMQSLNEVFNDNDGIVSGLVNSILDLPARAIPTFSKQIADMTDGTQRTTFEYGKPIQTVLNKMAVKIPGLNKTLAPSIDTMGREIQKYGGKNNIFNVFLNPANVNTENISESAEEIYRLYKEVGDKSIMPRVAPYYLNKKGEKITFTSEQRAEYQKVSGQIIDDNVLKLINNQQYNNLNNDKKAYIIKNLVNYSYNVAQKEVLNIEISDTYKKAYNYSKIGNITDYYILKSQEFTSNVDKNGNTISGSKKNKVVNYINSMDIPNVQRAILIKLNNYSVDGYDEKIINYINSQKITIDDKKALYEQLGYKIKNGRVYW